MKTKLKSWNEIWKKLEDQFYICKDSICSDPKIVLGSNVKGPNNKFVEHGCHRTRLTPKEKQLNLTFIDGLTPI